ncbi:MAG: heme lyase CcmF/NrfE family subunit [Gammaproteobacteria bacterium]|nr:heme lyase CcmF/NrfE family subunit [Gammaproteobacteria bacterium]
MIAEIGQFSLILALVFSTLLATLPLIGSLRGIDNLLLLAKPAARALFLLTLISYVCLTLSFLNNDFSVAYVANTSNSYLPLIYKISGVWGGHEGSLLLWTLILATWTMAVSFFSKGIPEIMVARVLSVMGMIGFGFLLFTLLTSNPFDRLFPVPLEGRDLNPLLQDVGLAIHPPMLYIGYVGFSVAFAFSVAAMISGRFDAAWARWSRPWTNIAWLFLTIGIALGSWWAYYELGWGGWWFWDPVENASFMPWLIGTALIHSLAATEKRGVFKAWTVLLSVFAFSLSLLGTFLVRSGVLTSVHAFATDPARGLFILIFLTIVVGGSLTLFAWRAPKIVSRVHFNVVSREMAILLNNIFLGILCFAVLIGTLYPLVIDALGMGKISVGPPYFDFIFMVIGIPLTAMIGVGTLIRWKNDRIDRISTPVMVAVALSLGIGFSSPLLMGHYSLGAGVGIATGLFVIVLNLANLMARTSKGKRLRGLKSTPRSFYGMVVAHIGIGVFIIGVTMTNTYSVEKDIRMIPRDIHNINGYEFSFQGVTTVKGPNYQAIQGHFDVTKEEKKLTTLRPEKRTYLVQQNPMTEAAIDAGFTRDLYVALGEPLEEAKAWAVRVYFKPFIRWIWLGALIMALGGGLAASDKRYRRTRQSTNTSSSTIDSTPLSAS